MKSVSTLDLRRQLGRVLDDVASGGEPVLITRRNQPLVVLVPADRYETGISSRVQRLDAAAARVAEWRAEYASRIAEADSVGLVRDDRNRR